MFGTMPEERLRQSWFKGILLNAALIDPVYDARIALAAYSNDEPKARKLRVRLERIFNDWKIKHGEVPDSHFGGLLGNVYAGKTLEECPPYACMGNRRGDYADLLLKLRTDGYVPLIELDNEIGYQCVSALLVLSEAVKGNVESAVKAHLEIQLYQREFQEKLNRMDKAHNKIMTEKILPLVRIAQCDQERRSQGGKASGKTRNNSATEWKDKAIKKAKALINAGNHGKHELVGIISPIVERSPTIVRKCLQEAGILEKRK